MRVSLLCVVLCISLVGCAESKGELVDQKEREVTEDTILLYAIDGDTVVSSIGTIRLVGIDTPEKWECGFTSATQRMRELIKDEQAILIPDRMQESHDKYGRLLRYIEIDGVDIGEVMLSEGFARVFPWLPADRKEHYSEVEEMAEENGVGSWVDCDW